MRCFFLIVGILMVSVSGCRNSNEQQPLGVGVIDGAIASEDPSTMAGNAVDAPDVEALERETKPPRRLSRDDQVIRNCYLVRDAAEAWSRENNGGYPGAPWGDANTEGHTLIDLLPGGEELENPYNGDKNLPLYFAYPGPGVTDYLSYAEDGVGVVGYMITGWGEGGELVRITQNWADSLIALDSIVVANCFAVKRAVERFAFENGGEYPDCTADKTLGGNTLIDLLPGSVLLRNPYHSCRTEPVDGASASPGQTGYVASYAGGSCRGYAITGTGRYDTIITIYKDPNEPDAHRPAKVTIYEQDR